MAVIARPAEGQSVVDFLRKHRKMMKVGQLADLLSYSPSHLYDIVKEGTLPSYSIKGSIRFDPPVVAEWLQKQV